MMEERLRPAFNAGLLTSTLSEDNLRVKIFGVVT